MVLFIGNSLAWHALLSNRGSLYVSYYPVYFDLWIIIDYNLQDGKVSVDEYIGDMYKPEDGIDEEEPDWVKQEREQFASYRSVMYTLFIFCNWLNSSCRFFVQGSNLLADIL